MVYHYKHQRKSKPKILTAVIQKIQYIRQGSPVPTPPAAIAVGRAVVIYRGAEVSRSDVVAPFAHRLDRPKET